MDYTGAGLVAHPPGYILLIAVAWLNHSVLAWLYTYARPHTEEALQNVPELRPGLAVLLAQTVLADLIGLITQSLAGPFVPAIQLPAAQRTGDTQLTQPCHG